MEYNGVDLRTASAEQAAYELAQPVQEHVSILAVFRPELYREVYTCQPNFVKFKQYSEKADS